MAARTLEHWSLPVALTVIAALFLAGLGVVSGCTVGCGVTASAATPVAGADLAAASNDSSQSPYGESAASVPGEIEAENFDEGGEGVAYHDTTENLFNSYRSRDSRVDLELARTGGYNVESIDAGEWLEYTVRADASGTYTVTVTVASTAGNKSLEVTVDGATVGTATVPATDGDQAWTAVTVGEVDLDSGEHVVRVTAEDADWTFDAFTLERVADDSDTTETPTATATPTATQTETATATPTATRAENPTDTATATPTETATATVTETETRTETATQTETATRTETATETQTATETATETETRTQTQTETATAAETETQTETDTETETETQTGTQTETETETETQTETETETETQTETETETETQTETETETETEENETDGDTVIDSEDIEELQDNADGPEAAEEDTPAEERDCPREEAIRREVEEIESEIGDPTDEQMRMALPANAEQCLPEDLKVEYGYIEGEETDTETDTDTETETETTDNEGTETDTETETDDGTDTEEFEIQVEDGEVPDLEAAEDGPDGRPNGEPPDEPDGGPPDDVLRDADSDPNLDGDGGDSDAAGVRAESNTPRADARPNNRASQRTAQRRTTAAAANDVADTDGDGVVDSEDPAPHNANVRFPDTDGDGVVDAQDYAPRDPSVQDKEDLADGGFPLDASPELLLLLAAGAVPFAYRRYGSRVMVVWQDGDSDRLFSWTPDDDAPSVHEGPREARRTGSDLDDEVVTISSEPTFDDHDDVGFVFGDEDESALDDGDEQ